MDKVTLNGLSIFLTHRCNMACPHCLRGAAEDMDISPDTIDALLEQTEMIDTLSLTGGEPLLAVDTIKYIAYDLAKRGIMLFRLQIVTNGFEYNEQFVEAVKMFRQIIDISRREGCEDDTYDPIDEKWRILIGVNAMLAAAAPLWSQMDIPLLISRYGANGAGKSLSMKMEGIFIVRRTFTPLVE